MGEPRIRDALDQVPEYRAGKPPAPGSGPSYKLSSNENPYGMLPRAEEAVREAATRVHRYPDMGARLLYEALAQRHGVAPERLAAATGSVAVLYHLLQAVCEPGDEVVYAWRSFEAYPIAVRLVGATPVEVPVTPTAEHDLEAMADAISPRTRVVVLCTPNNPTGPAISGADVLAFVRRVPADVLVVVDEAYVEFVRPAVDTARGGALPIVADHDNVVVLRTFSKAYGLAGLRVGYAVAPERIASAVRKVALPFGVSDLAQVAAVASLDDEDVMRERVEHLVSERTRVLAGLRAAGWFVPDSQANFVWLPTGAETMDVAAAFEQRGVSVRPFPGDGIRVTIGEDEANDLVLEVARGLSR
ncbi:histidinol-phosphate aminotransferase [Mumia flava]|uniref:Aromatic amino acid aminotransferase n=1 Tax=Mumia flava TaxID=1348852 RepID=A0A0B2BIQ5_9ACTN|nr:histidinol-phosphate transaminase [Mumia flava]PJJ57931.1 histidinol-phosphate aminotransferase [Mumia flava]